MSATLSHLQLNTYFLKEISYSVKDNLETIPDEIDEIIPVGLEITDITLPIEESDKNNWRCELVIKSNDEPDSFYNFRIVMIGFFQTNPQLKVEQAQVLAESNCPAVLYSTSREIIATVTRRSPYPAVLLPLVTFVKNLEKSEKVKKAVKKRTDKKTVKDKKE